MKQPQWEENVILVDAACLDRTAFDLTVYFERVIGRRIPEGDLCQWLDCVALDGGIRPGNHAIQVVFLHENHEKGLRHFKPSGFKDELSGQAFKDNLGEFSLMSFPIESIVSPADFYIQCAENIMEEAGVKRIMMVPDMDNYGERLRKLCAGNQDKEITLFSMSPADGKGFACENLGYSLLCALGISSGELQSCGAPVQE